MHVERSKEYGPGTVLTFLTLVALMIIAGCGGNDAGSKWKEVENDVSLPLCGVWAASLGEAWVIACDGQGAMGIILEWDGNIFDRDFFETDHIFRDIAGAGDSVWVFGNTPIYQLYHKCLSYHLGANGDWQGFECGDEAMHGVGVGLSGNAAGVGNSGNVWSWNTSFWEMEPGAVEGEPSLKSVWYGGSGEVWVAGSNGSIARKDGPGWEISETPTEESLYCIWGRGPDDIWAVGSEGTVLKYDGSVWTTEDTGFGQTDFHGVWGVPEGDLWVVGEAGTVLHRDLSGVWTREAGITTTSDLLDVRGSSAADIWVVGDGGIILHHES